MYFQILGAVTMIISVAYELYSSNSHKKLVVMYRVVWECSKLHILHERIASRLGSQIGKLNKAIL